MSDKKSPIPFFHAVKRGPIPGDGTVGALVDWLEKFINLIFPDNGIEYWSEYRGENTKHLRRDDPVPTNNALQYFGCYVKHGLSEGRVIQIDLTLRDCTVKTLCWIKSFGKEDECWLIARAISKALESIFVNEEVPEIMEMADKLPRQYRHSRVSNLHRKMVLSHSDASLSVFDETGVAYDHREWTSHGDAAHYYVEARMKDWETVLTNMQVKYEVRKTNQIFVADLPGYTISDRDVPECKGFYVLPPGGRPFFDCDYLGYFPSSNLAIEAARAHQRSAA